MASDTAVLLDFPEFEPDAIMPAQFYRARNRPLSPEELLLLAVVEDAWRTVCVGAQGRQHNGHNSGARKRYEQDFWWFEHQDRPSDGEYWFSFERACEVFGWDAEVWRAAVRRVVAQNGNAAVVHLPELADARAEKQRSAHPGRSGSTIVGRDGGMDEQEAVFARIGTPCGYCFELPAVCWDHMVPRSFGGSNAKENLMPSCLRCNGWLSDKVFGSIEARRLYVQGRLRGLDLSVVKSTIGMRTEIDWRQGKASMRVTKERLPVHSDRYTKRPKTYRWWEDPNDPAFKVQAVRRERRERDRAEFIAWRQREIANRILELERVDMGKG